VGCNAISAIGCRELALLLIRTSPVGLNWTTLRKVYWAEGAGFPTGYWNGVVEFEGLESPMQYAEVTLGRKSNVDPVPGGVSVCVHRWRLSILRELAHLDEAGRIHRTRCPSRYWVPFSTQRPT